MNPSDLLNLAARLPFAAAATAGFAVLFDVPRRALPAAAIIGVLGYALRGILMLLGLTTEPATYLAGVLIGLLAHFEGERMRLPLVILTVPAVIPLIPGVPAFRAVVDFTNGDYTSGLANVVRTVLIAGALGAGLGTITALVRMRNKPLY